MNLISLSVLYYFSALDQIIIKDILNYKYIKNVIVYHCTDAYNGLIFQKFLNNHTIRVLYQRHNDSLGFFLTYSTIGIVVDTSCPDWFEHLQHTNKAYFQNPYTWILKTNNLDLTRDKLTRLSIDVDSDVIIFSKDKQTNKHVIHEFYNTGLYTNGSFILRKIGHWDSALYLAQARRTDLSGVVLKSAVVIIEPLNHITFEQYLENINPTIVDTVHKLKFYWVLTYLKQMYNYSYDFRRTNSWGYLRNGSFDGMTGALGRQEVDIGGSPMFFRPDRAKFVQFVVDVWQTRLRFILRHPKHPGGYYTIYTRPFTPTVWCSIAAAMVLIMITLFLMLKLKMLRTVNEDVDSSVSLVMLIIISALSQQGTIFNRSATCVKIVFFSTSLFFLILYQYYNGTVVSTLLQEPQRTIRTLTDLLQSNLEAGAEDVLYNKDFFKRTTDPIATELYKKKIISNNHPNYFNLERGMSLVKRGGFAFHVDCVAAYQIMRKSFTEREICDIQEIRMFPPQILSAALKKGSPYKEHIAIGIRRMFEAGVMHRLRTIWGEVRPLCVHTPDSSVFSVSIREFSMALAILAVGCISAIIIFIGEIILFNINRRPRHFNFVQ